MYLGEFAGVHPAQWVSLQGSMAVRFSPQNWLRLGEAELLLQRAEREERPAAVTLPV